MTQTRIIRTTGTRRRLKNAPDGSLSPEEYFEAMTGLACLFYKGGWYDKVQESLKEYKHF